MRNKAIPEAPPHDDGFLSEIQILPRVGISRRTMKNWRDRGLIPFVRLPGSRLVKYHWPSVEAAILRQQKGE
jgi:predicted site-specific integrase-resolvase